MKSRLLSIAVSVATMVALDAKKVTKDFLESEIAEVKYQRLGGTLTHCTIYTHDGFTFTGESACIDPAQFDEEIGKQIAYQQAFEKMWLPYGFWLHKTLKHQNQPKDGENKAQPAGEFATVSVEHATMAKRLAYQTDNFIEFINGDNSVDKRWLAIAKTDLQKAFMSLNRAIAGSDSF